MVTTEGEVAPYQLTELHAVLLLLQQTGEKTLVQQCATRPGVVELGERLHHRRRTVGICSVRGRGAVADRFTRQPAVGRGPHHLAEIDVTGGREHIQVVLSARLDVRLPVDGIHQVVVHLHGDGICKVVIVAEEGGAVHDRLAQHLLPFEVVKHRIQDPVHREALRFEDVTFQRRETVGRGSQTAALDVAGVVTRSTVVVIPAARHAVVDHHGEERRRGIFGKHSIDVVAHPHLQVDHVVQLFQESIVQFFVSLKGARIACLQPYRDARDRIDPVVERHFQDLGHVQVAGQQVGLLAEGPHLDAAAASPLAGIPEGLALAQQLGHVDIRIEDGGIAVSLTDHPHGGHQEGIGRLFANVHREARLQDVQLFGHLQQQVGEFARAVGAIAADAADVDVGKVVVGSALPRRDPHLGRCRVVVHLDPETGDQLFGLLAG